MMVFSLSFVSNLGHIKLSLLLLSLLLSYTYCLSFSTIMYQLFTTSSTSSTGIKNNSIKSNMKSNMINTTTSNENMNNIDNIDTVDSVDTTHPLLNIDRSYLHITEYPYDNYNHIYGYDDNNHQLSKLQLISKLRIEDTIRNKKPIDTVSY